MRRHKKILFISICLCSNLFYNKGHNQDGTLKRALDYFHIIFSNSHFSINICSNSSKFLENLLQGHFEGSMSQNFDLKFETRFPRDECYEGLLKVVCMFSKY